MKTCSVEGCTAKVKAKGLCEKHYRAERRRILREEAGFVEVNDIADDQVSVELKRQQARKLQLANAVTEGKLVVREQVEQSIAEKLADLATSFESIMPRVRQKLPHLSADDFAVVDGEIRQAIEDIV